MSNPSSSEQVHVSSHPVLLHKLTLLRNSKTQSREFRHNMRDITFYLGYEATADITTKPVTISTQDATSCQGVEIREEVAIVPILRSGLGMVEPMLELLPNSAVHHIGMYRNKDSLLPIQYYNKLPREHNTELAIVLEPLIATSGTINATVSILKRWGAPRIRIICMVASRQGLTQLLEAHPEVEIYLGAIDETLSEEGQILPGLGDCGDRLFSTPELVETALRGQGVLSSPTLVPLNGSSSNGGGKKRRTN